MRISLTRIIFFLLLSTCSINFADGQSSLPPRVIPFCQKPDGGRKSLQWNKLLAFTLPEKDVKFRRGKVDVDYVRDTIQRKSTSAFMSFWAGPLSFGPEPPKDLVAKSPSFSKRDLQTVDGSRFGTESFGTTSEGTYWRWTFIAFVGINGLEFKVSSRDDAAFFDQIIDSVCILPPVKNPH